jgi:hypothetical protein
VPFYFINLLPTSLLYISIQDASRFSRQRFPGVLLVHNVDELLSVQLLLEFSLQKLLRLRVLRPERAATFLAFATVVVRVSRQAGIARKICVSRNRECICEDLQWISLQVTQNH